MNLTKIFPFQVFHFTYIDFFVKILSMLTNQQLDVLIGSILGDGSLSKTKFKSNSRFPVKLIAKHN